MSLPNPIRWLLFGAAGLIGLILLLLLIISFFRIPIDLENQKGLIESIAARAIERQISINGGIRVTTSLWPVFIIEDVHIKNPENFETADFARLQSIRVEVGIIRLLLGKIRVKKFKVNGLELFLRADDKGSVNWIFSDTPEPDEPEEKAEFAIEEKIRGIRSDSLIVDRLDLSNVLVSYFAPGMKKPSEFIIDSGTGSAQPGETFQITLKGSALEEPYEVMIRVASLQELLEKNRSWLNIETKTAGAQIKFSGNIDLKKINRSLQLKLEIKGERLEKFNRLLGLDLPPIPSYGLNASLSKTKGLIKLTDLKLQVSNSELTGNIKAVKTGPVPDLAITMHSPKFQINDFVFDEWSPFRDVKEGSKDAEDFKTDKTEDKTEERAGQVKQTGKVRELFSPESLEKLNASLTVSADKVLSGEDRIGSGKITASLKDGRISLDPLNLAIPGGSLSMNLSIKPGRVRTEGSLRVLVKNFDFGVLARRADPKTDMGGIINIDVDLKSSAKDFSDLLAQGNGYFDFSAKPENLQAGIMDLWVVNVISAIVTQSVKGQSHVEYLVGRWSMKDGYLEPDIFVMDTTRMRICGKGWVDFNTEKFSLKVVPTPKKPQFFSLATPISVEGDFKDFGMGIAGSGVIGTGLRFAISPLQVPLQTLFGKTIPADASDLTGIQLGAENRGMKRPAGCRGW